jgi:ketosteroid isomerase-like protein/quinol monooxygenase YgiN
MSESYRVCAVFTLKDQECKKRFIEFANGDNGLSVTRSAKGCLSLDMFESREDEMKLIIWQKWDCKENQEAYIKHRHEDGTFEMIGEIVACPPDITPIKDMVMKTNEDQIKNIVEDMCNVDYKVGMRHMSDDCVFIRPSGNPLDKKGWEKMMTNDDVKAISSKLLTIHKLAVGNTGAYVCYSSHAKFTYKGTENDDVAVFSSVMKKKNGVWKVVHGQRSTGRKPSEPLPFA